MSAEGTRKAKCRCGIVLFKRTVEPAVRRALLEIEAIMVLELTINRNTVSRKSTSNSERDGTKDKTYTDTIVIDSRHWNVHVFGKRLATRHRRQ